MSAKKNSSTIVLLVFFILLLAMSALSCSSNQVFVIGEQDVFAANLGIEYYAIAQGWESQKKYEKAIEFYKKAQKFKVKSQNEFYYKFAYNYAKLKKWEESRFYYAILLKQDPDNKILKKSMAYIDAMSGNLEGAYNAYRAFYAENPKDQEIGVNYIYVLLAQEKKESAKLVYEAVKKNFPDLKELETIEKQFEEKKEEPLLKETPKQVEKSES